MTIENTTNNVPILFMPDISGFTSFVNHTEVRHSEHIISELLELVIAKNNLKLKLAEIEGDALLFYDTRPTWKLSDLIEQCFEMFSAFHQHLQLYESQRICECGACRSAINLTLKFLAHKEDYGFLHVHGQEKPHGKAVVAIHRLLKNNLNQKEYVLLSGDWKEELANEAIHKTQGLSFVFKQIAYEIIGELDISYALTGHWHKSIKALPRTVLPKPIQKPITLSRFYPVSLERAYAVIIDLNIRSKWNPSTHDVKILRDGPNRIGNEHVCVFDNGKSVNLTSVGQRLSDGRLLYGEIGKNVKLFKELTSYFILEKQDKGVLVTIEIYLTMKGLLYRLLLPMVKKAMLKNISHILDELAQFFEKDTSTEHEYTDIITKEEVGLRDH